MAGLPVCFAWVLFGHQLQPLDQLGQGVAPPQWQPGALTALCVVMLWY